LRTLSVRLLTGLLAILAGACAADAPTTDPATAQRKPAACELGVLQDGAFLPWVDGMKAEIIVGYQGYMLVIGRVHVSAGELPVKPKVRMTVSREGGEPSISSVWRVPVTVDNEGHAITEPLEMWLFPPVLEDYLGRNGSVQVELVGLDRSCTARTAVEFVDEEFCKHMDTGEIICVDGSTKGH